MEQGINFIILAWMRDGNKAVTRVARDYVDRCGGILPALAELLDEMEIAVGIGDNLSVKAFIEIARAVLGASEARHSDRSANDTRNPTTKRG